MPEIKHTEEDFASPHAEQRGWAIMEASRSASGACLPILMSLLKTDTYENRRHIVRAFGRIGGEDCKRTLLDLLASESGLILGDIAKSLGQLKSVQSLDALSGLLSHETDWVKQNASWAIKKIKEEA